MFEWFKKDKAQQIELTISTRTVLRVLLLVMLSLLFVSAVRLAAHTLTLIFIAFFLTISLNAPVHWLSVRMPGKLRGSRAGATGVSFLMIVIVLGVFLVSIVPPLIRQTGSFLNAAPRLVDDLHSDNNDLGRYIRRNNLEQPVDKLSDELSSKVGDVGGTAVSTASRLGGSIFSTMTVLALTFMMLVEAPGWLQLFRKFVPKDQRNHIDELASAMYMVIRGYVNGQVLLALTAALLILVPLLVLHINYPAALVVIVFICGLIPMVGHFIGAAIVTAVALFTSFGAALAILAYYILYQQIENYVVQPAIQSNSTNMSPLLVFGSVIIGVSFGGLFGGLVAIPVAGCLRVLVLDYLKTRKYFESQPTVQTIAQTK